MPANEVEAFVRKELSSLSTGGIVAAMKMKAWSPVQARGTQRRAAGAGGARRALRRPLRAACAAPLACSTAAPSGLLPAANHSKQRPSH